jgi:hypothetical protein
MALTRHGLAPAAAAARRATLIDVQFPVYSAQQGSQTTTWVPYDGTIPTGQLPLTAAQTFYAFWTDNRDAKVGRPPFEPDSDIGESAALVTLVTGLASRLRSAIMVPATDQPRSRRA